MATTTSNSIPTTDISSLISGIGSQGVQALLDGFRWGTNLSGTYLTYSFPGEYEETAGFIVGYGTDAVDEWHAGWWSLDPSEMTAVAQVLTIYEHTANLHFSYVGEHPSSNTTVGELRYAVSEGVNDELSENDAYAHAYTPGDYPEAGDVWLSDEWYIGHSSGPARGTYDFETLLHETGHALGLKHPFESSDSNGVVIPSVYDSLMYTVMSYNTYVGDDDSGAYFYPTTPMYYDVAALQYLYGAPPNFKDAWTYSSSGQYWETIADSGGIDTLTYNSAVGEYTHMSLVPGNYCAFGQAIHYYNVPSQYEYDYRTVWIGPYTIIEKAVGGPGHEEIIGNSVSNTLSGLGGNDTISGGAGADKIDGGAGNDKLSGGAGHDTLTGGAGADLFVFGISPKGNDDRIVGFNSLDDTIYLDDKIFGRFAKGFVDPSHFFASTKVDVSGAAKTGQWLLYDTDSGNLYYDNDGNGAHTKVLVATLAGDPALVSGDLKII
jgi:hypothetical protein